MLSSTPPLLLFAYVLYTVLCINNPYLDRLSLQPPPEYASVRLLNNLLESRSLVDIWWIQHPTDRDYSFYSHVHKSYTREDYFLIDSILITRITNSKYNNIQISDDSPVTLSLKLSLPKQGYSWRFNPNLLSDSGFTETIEAKLKDLNDIGCVSDYTLWETLKVILHGNIIS